MGGDQCQHRQGQDPREVREGYVASMYLDITINVVITRNDEYHHKECHYDIQTVSALYNTHNSLNVYYEIDIYLLFGTIYAVHTL